MKKPRAIITDHALLRYLERVLGIDVEGIRDEVGRKVDRAVEMGACGTTIEGWNYRIEAGRVVTVVSTGSPDIRLGRKRGRA